MRFATCCAIAGNWSAGSRTVGGSNPRGIGEAFDQPTSYRDYYGIQNDAQYVNTKDTNQFTFTAIT
jgi:hypothetical protein